MPRVNRNLQRRLDARRERERRRPATERRYVFAPPIEEGAETNGAATASTPPPAQATTPVAERAVPRGVAALATDYGYVWQDLRRIAIVVGSLLVLVAVLWLIIH